MNCANAVAMAASIALPPRRSAPTPASTAIGPRATTMPPPAPEALVLAADAAASSPPGPHAPSEPVATAPTPAAAVARKALRDGSGCLPADRASAGRRSVPSVFTSRLLSRARNLREGAHAARGMVAPSKGLREVTRKGPSVPLWRCPADRMATDASKPQRPYQLPQFLIVTGCPSEIGQPRTPFQLLRGQRSLVVLGPQPNLGSPPSTPARYFEYRRTSRRRPRTS